DGCAVPQHARQKLRARIALPRELFAQAQREVRQIQSPSGVALELESLRALRGECRERIVTGRQRASQSRFDLVQFRERAGNIVLRAIDARQAKQSLVDDDLIPRALGALKGSFRVVL